MRLFAIFSFLFLISSAVHASEFKEIDKEKSPVYFSIKYKMQYLGTGWDDAYSYRRFLINVGDNLSDGPFSNIIMEQLAPNYVIDHHLPLSKIKTIYPFLQSISDNAVSLEDGKSKNFLYELHTVSGRTCLIFKSLGGSSFNDRGVDNNTFMVHGFYCNTFNKTMSVENIGKILSSIGVKAVDTPVPTPKFGPEDFVS